MNTAINNAIDNTINFLTLSWLTGPIFDKELRVSSRRKRNYTLRFAYIALLAITAIFVWSATVRYSGPVSLRAVRMAEAGMIIICVIIWFQFIATQIVAGVMLSTAISDEIYHKTLGTLMTTPISGFQIVMGKLLSKLLQTILLIAISFPLLSIVRIFGGIPWDYVVSSLALTFVTVIFVGSLSLFYSIFTKKAYVSLILTIITLAVIYLLIPLLVAIFCELTNIRLNDRKFFSFFSYMNPYIAMIVNTSMLGNAGAAGRFTTHFYVTCLVMLSASAVLLSVAIAFVRKVALRQATGQPDIFTPKAKSRNKNVSVANNEYRIRRVNTSPVLWKELQGSFLGKRKILFSVFLALSLIILIFTYIFCAAENALDDRGVHMGYVTIFFSIGFLFTVILPATAITHEKESRSWHLLLVTTLSDWEIAIGKFIGSIKRCLPAWAYLFGHVILFTLFGFIHPLGIFQIVIITSGVCTLLIGSGLYFSALFKRTTTAVIMNFIFAAVIWGAIPLVIALIVMIGRNNDLEDFLEVYANSIPFFQVVISMDSTADGFTNLRNAHWATGSLSPFPSTMIMIGFSVLNAVTGLFLTWRAKEKFRKNIF